MKRRKMKRCCAAVPICMLVLCGCSSKHTVMNEEADSEDVTTITFFGTKYEPENVKVIEEIISGFMKENPDIRVSYESLKGTQYFEALEKRMETGKGDDVFMVNHDILLKLKSKGQAADLSGLRTIPDYTDQMLTQMKDEGKIYWVPTTVSAFGLYCNEDLLKKHKQKTPGNLKEWESVCSYFTKKGITPVICNNEDPDKSLKTEKTSDDLEEFAKGKSPFMLTGAWAAGRVKTMNPDLKFSVSPLPLLENGSMLVVNADTRLSVNADSRHVKAAEMFVEYFTQAENIQKFSDQQCSFSPLKGGKSSSVEEIRPLLSCYKDGKTVIGTDSMLKLPIWNLTAEASKQILSGKPVRSVMNRMDLQTEKERKVQ